MKLSRYLKEGFELAETIQDHVVLMWASSELGRVHLRQGRLDEASRALELSRKFLTQDGHLSLIWVPLRNALCERELAASEQQSADERSASMKHTQAVCRKALDNGRRYRGLLPEAMRLWGVYEFDRGRSQHAKKWWTRSKSAAEAAGQRHDAVLSDMEAEMRLGERAQKGPE